MNRNTLDLFKQLDLHHKNSLLSPFCLELALHLLAKGAKKEYQKEVYRFLDVKEIDNAFAEALEQLHTLMELQQVNQKYSVFYSQFVQPISSFFDVLATHFPLHIKQKTRAELKGDFLLETHLNLKTKWANKFSSIPGQTAFFTLANGEEVEAEFMNQSNKEERRGTLWLEGEHFAAVQIPMEEKRLCMEVYLPNEVDGLNNLIAGLSTEMIQAWGNAFEKVDFIEVLLPKFTIEQDTKLNDHLVNLGFESLFFPTWDFTPMFDCPDIMRIIKISQENRFKINKEGVEATSVTRILGGIAGISKVGKYVFFEATHPFLYLIRDRKTNQILFLGTFTAPDLETDFSRLYKNKEEEKAYIDTSEVLSFRVGFVLAAYTFESFLLKYEYNNDFTNWYLDLLWQVGATPSGDLLKERLNQLKTVTTFGELDPEEVKLSPALQESRKQFLEEGPVQLKDIYYAFIDRLYFIVESLENFINSKDYFLHSCLALLRESNFPIPEYHHFADQLRLPENPFGLPIQRQTLSYYYQANLPRQEISPEQKSEKEKQQKLRNFLPHVFDLSLRGKAYLGMVCFNEYLRTQDTIPAKTKIWAQRVLDLLSTEPTDRVATISKLYFGAGYEMTGFFEDNDYFTKETLKEFAAAFPFCYKIQDNIESVLNSYQFLSPEEAHFNVPFSSTSRILENMITENLPFPDLEYFKQFKTPEADYLGPVIELNREWLEQF